MPKLLKTPNASHDDRKHLLEVVKISCIGTLLIGGTLFGAYLLAFKPSATPAQQSCGSVLLTATACGSIGYALGKKPDKE